MVVAVTVAVGLPVGVVVIVTVCWAGVLCGCMSV